MIDPSPAIIVAFIGGPAILANACAVLHSSATVRHNLSIAQWRDFNSSIAANDRRLEALYAEPKAMVAFAEERIRLQLKQTRHLILAASLFAATSFIALISAFAAEASLQTAAFYSSLGMVVTGITAVLLMLFATVLFFQECARAEKMMSLHRLHSRGVESRAAEGPRIGADR